MLNKGNLALLLLTTIAYFAIAQPFNDKTSQADQLAASGNYTEEISVRKKIIDTTADKDMVARQKYKIEVAQYHQTKDAEQALPHLQNAIELFKKIKKYSPTEKAELHTLLGSALLNVNKAEEAQQVLSENIAYLNQEFKDDRKSFPLKMTNYTELSATYSSLFNYEKSIYWMQEAIKAAELLHGPKSKEVAAYYAELAIIYSYTENLHAQIEHGEKAIKIYESLNLDDKLQLFKQYSTQYSSLKYYGDRKATKVLFEKIKLYYEKYSSTPEFANSKDADMPNIPPAKTIFYYVCLQEAHIDLDTVAVAKLNLLFATEVLPTVKRTLTYSEINRIASFYFESGATYQKTGNYQKAKQYYLTANTFAKANEVPFLQLQACLMLSTLGVDYKQWDDAIIYINRAMAMPEFEQFNQELTINHNLGYAYFGKKEYDKALPYLEKVLNYYQHTTENISSNYAVQNLLEVAQMLEQLAIIKGDKALQQRAFQAFSQSSIQYSNLYRGGEINWRLANYQRQINRGMLQHSVLLNNHFASSLERVEIANSDFLWSSFLSNNTAVEFLDKPRQIQADIDSLQVAQSRIAIALTDTALNESEKAALTLKKANAQKRTNQLSAQLQQEFPMFQQFARGLFDVKAFQQNLKPEDVVLRYVVTDSLVFAYVINSKSIVLYQLQTNKNELEELVLACIRGVRSNQEQTNNETTLYEQLIKPLQIPDAQNLIIINDDFLSYLPFEILKNKQGKYLLEQYNISYARSLRLWELQQQKMEKANKNLLAFAPEYDVKLAANTKDVAVKELVRDGLYQLKGAQSEAIKVSDLFDGKLYAAEVATKDNFIKIAGNYNLLHLAMHAVVRADSSYQSGFIFANGERLSLEEIYKMSLPAEMAVLSACNTGGGELVLGEGVQSLSRAFVYSGVRSTVMSLWQVPDEATAQIMIHFYDYLKKGVSKSEALKNAKLDYLKNATVPALQHPYYWAGFVLSGDTAPITKEHNYNSIIIGGLIGAAVGVGIALQARRRKREAA